MMRKVNGCSLDQANSLASLKVFFFPVEEKKILLVSVVIVVRIGTCLAEHELASSSDYIDYLAENSCLSGRFLTKDSDCNHHSAFFGVIEPGPLNFKDPQHETHNDFILWCVELRQDSTVLDPRFGLSRFLQCG